MSVLVIGGMGSIGAFVTRRLVELQADPVVYDIKENTTFLSDVKGKYKFIQGDVLDLAKLTQTIKDYHTDRIIHLAAYFSETDPPAAVKWNAEGTATVLQAATQTKVKRVVYTSARAVFSECTGRYAHPYYVPVTEDFPTGDDNMGFYGVVKLCGEKLAAKYTKVFGLDTISLRFGMTLGPGKLAGHGGANPHTIHERIIENSMCGKPIKHPQGRDQKDDKIYVRDTANGVVLACFAGDTKHKTFNLSMGVGTTLVDFADAVKKVFPKSDIEIGPGVDYLFKNWGAYMVYDISRAKAELGFNPQYSLEGAVVDYVETLKKFKIEPTYTP